MKIIEKIKEAISGPQFPEQVCKKILKNKKINDTQKLELVLKTYKDYFSSRLLTQVKLQCLENHYEYLCAAGENLQEEYQSIFNATLKLNMFNEINNLGNITKSLNDANTSNFSVQDKQILECISKLNKVNEVLKDKILIDLYINDKQVCEAYDSISDKVLRTATNDKVHLEYFDNLEEFVDEN